MNRTGLAMIVSLPVLAGLLGILMTNGSSTKTGNTHPKSDGSGVNGDAPQRPLMVYCGASNRAVMEAIKTDYENETGSTLEIQYGPSQTLLSSIEVSRLGDLYLPADDSYLRMAHEKGLIKEQLMIGRQQGVVAVKKGNPKSIRSFNDLLQDDLRLVQANPDSAAIGNITRQVLQKQGLWEKLDSATIAYRATVTEVANDILIGAADAGLVYDAMLHTYPDLEYVELSELSDASSAIGIGVVSVTKQPQRALHFARYVSARDRGRKRYNEYGFRTKDGDEWADVPELTFFAGSMLRPAVEDTITEFEQRERVRVSRVYNGCGILVAQMKAGQHPDAYFACDTEFMQQVTDLFPEPVAVSLNELVILVQKGNPQGIRTLRDLAKKGLRVGIGHEKQCAMGWLTQRMLKEDGIQEEVMENVTVQTPTGDMLVNQLRTGSLDAAVVYLSNAAGSVEVLDAIRIHGLSCSVATQPFAVAEDSRYRSLAGRLFEKICSAASREDFLAEGFRWQKSDTPVTADRN